MPCSTRGEASPPILLFDRVLGHSDTEYTYLTKRGDGAQRLSTRVTTNLSPGRSTLSVRELRVTGSGYVLVGGVGGHGSGLDYSPREVWLAPRRRGDTVFKFRRFPGWERVYCNS